MGFVVDALAGLCRRLTGGRALRFGQHAPHLSVGARGERVACAHLKKNKYTVIDRNVRTPIGELDVLCVAPDKKTLVVVEVKARVMGEAGDTTNSYPPEFAVNHKKQQKLLRVTADVIRRRKLMGRRVRIDVVAVEFSGSEKPVVRHHIGAVRG